MTGPTIVGDWGTTRLRLFRLAAGTVARRVDRPGIGVVGVDVATALRAALAELTADVTPERVILCGMAGARGALLEAPYAACPTDVRVWAVAAITDVFDGAPLTVAAGLRCTNFVGVPDVMRGEETQIFGALVLRPDLARGRHVLLLPGTHAKWVALVDGVVERFQTFLTGEVFALLRDHSTLLRAGAATSDDANGFKIGLARADTTPFAHLFAARTAQLLDGRDATWATTFLSGLLIGAEVREALALMGTPERVITIGDPALAKLYARALAAHPISVELLDGEACSLAGLDRLAATKHHP